MQEMQYVVDKLHRMYPLFKFELRPNEEGIPNRLLIHITDTNRIHTELRDGDILSRETTLHLDHAHMTKTVSQNLTIQHPQLKFSVYSDPRGIYCSVSTNKGTSIGTLNLDKIDFQQILYIWGGQAEQASQVGWFFCTGHQVAHINSDSDYFHFAGVYCEAWGLDYPEEKEAALKEDYR